MLRWIRSPLLLAALLAAGGTSACSASATSASGSDNAGGSSSATTTGAGQGGQGGEGGEACVPATESCNGVDDDCNGGVDEGCVCAPGATQPCYSGLMQRQGVGPCASGVQTCDAAGQWGVACEGEVLPGAEACNLVDDDCNGAVDDALPDVTCGIGACQATVVACDNGVAPACTPIDPSVEVCDGVDNDCDQLVDESDASIGVVCASSSPGICLVGTLQCVTGALTCVSDQQPTTELCDDLDNDCNGMVDDNILGTGGMCTTGYPGVCSPGTISCQGASIDCFPIVPASAEVCDTLDNNCDGAADEGNPEGGGACATGQLGVCAAGTDMCLNGTIQCVADAIGSAETCNGLDDNCDGQPDEGNPGGGVACGCGGTTTCTNGVITCGGSIVYLQEDFANNSQGWTLGTTWAIGPTQTSSGQSAGNGDPATDHSPTSDNGVAGVVIGGNAPTALHAAYYYLTSPVFNTANAPGAFLRFYRWLNSDYTPYMANRVEVFNGSTWVVIFQTAGTSIFDATWVEQKFDISAYKNANMQIRFGYNINSGGVYTCSQWNVDDVLVTNLACP